MSNFDTPARDYMTSPLRSVGADESLETVYERLRELGYSALPVADDGRIVGLISRTDLLRLGRRQANTRPHSALLAFPETTAREAMTTEPAALPAEASLSDVAKLMVERRIHRILIEDDGEAIGIVTSRDLMRAIQDKKLNHPLSRYMSSPLFTVRATEPVSLATERLEKAGVTGLVVVDDEYPVGVFTQFEALDARDVRRETAVEEVMNVAILLLRSDMPIHRAAAQAAAMQVRRIVAMDYARAVGIVTGLDFARVVA